MPSPSPEKSRSGQTEEERLREVLRAKRKSRRESKGDNGDRDAQHDTDRTKSQSPSEKIKSTDQESARSPENLDRSQPANSNGHAEPQSNTQRSRSPDHRRERRPSNDRPSLDRSRGSRDERRRPRRHHHRDNSRRGSNPSRGPPGSRAPHDPYYPPRRGGGLAANGAPMRGPPPPHHWRGPPSSGPPASRHRRRDLTALDRYDDFGRRRPPSRRSRSRSVSRSSSGTSSGYSSRSRSRSHSRSRSRDRRPRRQRGGSSRNRRRSHSASSRSSYDSSGSSSSSSSSSGDSSTTSDVEHATQVDNTYTKDQRTVFVTQLVQRTQERDLKKFFTRKGCKVNEVILLRDKRTGKHKGCAYVEMKRMEDVSIAVGLSAEVPDFQRFPVLVKASEAEKNYLANASTATSTAAQMGVPIKSAPLLGPDGKMLEAQKVYIGSLDPSVSQEHLFALFSQFGQLEKVTLQMDSNTGLSKGFAFLTFHDPKEANLAIQTMANQALAGRPMKTGWASQGSSIPGVEVVTSDEFPADASTRAQRAYQVLAQLTMGVPVASVGQAPGTSSFAAAAAVPGGASRIPTVAEARASLAGAVAMAPATPAVLVPTPAVAPLGSPDAKIVGNADTPTKNVLIRNMFDKDKETDPGWEKDIKEEFEDECSKYGTITSVTVMHMEPGGKIYASFDSVIGAQKCASSLAGRWFDKRQLRVDFVADKDLPKDD